MNIAENNIILMDRYERIQAGYLKINGKTYPVYKGVNTIGRNKDAIINIVNLNVSSQHALIIVIDSGLHYISDLKSSNGTTCSKAKLKPFKLYELVDGSEIIFGNLTGTYTKVVQKENTVLNYTHGTLDSQSFTQSFYGASTQIMGNDTVVNVTVDHNYTDKSDKETDPNKDLVIHFGTIHAENCSLQPQISNETVAIDALENEDIHSAVTQLYIPDLQNSEDVEKPFQETNIHDAETQVLNLTDPRDNPTHDDDNFYDDFPDIQINIKDSSNMDLTGVNQDKQVEDQNKDQMSAPLQEADVSGINESVNKTNRRSNVGEVEESMYDESIVCGVNDSARVSDAHESSNDSLDLLLGVQESQLHTSQLQRRVVNRLNSDSTIELSEKTDESKIHTSQLQRRVINRINSDSTPPQITEDSDTDIENDKLPNKINSDSDTDVEENIKESTTNKRVSEIMDDSDFIAATQDVCPEQPSKQAETSQATSGGTEESFKLGLTEAMVSGMSEDKVSQKLDNEEITQDDLEVPSVTIHTSQIPSTSKELNSAELYLESVALQNESAASEMSMDELYLSSTEKTQEKINKAESDSVIAAPKKFSFKKTSYNVIETNLSVLERDASEAEHYSPQKSICNKENINDNLNSIPSKETDNLDIDIYDQATQKLHTEGALNNSETEDFDELFIQPTQKLDDKEGEENEDGVFVKPKERLLRKKEKENEDNGDDIYMQATQKLQTDELNKGNSNDSLNLKQNVETAEETNDSDLFLPRTEKLQTPIACSILIDPPTKHADFIAPTDKLPEELDQDCNVLESSIFDAPTQYLANDLGTSTSKSLDSSKSYVQGANVIVQPVDDPVFDAPTQQLPPGFEAPTQEYLMEENQEEEDSIFLIPTQKLDTPQKNPKLISNPFDAATQKLSDDSFDQPTQKLPEQVFTKSTEQLPVEENPKDDNVGCKRYYENTQCLLEDLSETLNKSIQKVDDAETQMEATFPSQNVRLGTQDDSRPKNPLCSVLDVNTPPESQEENSNPEYQNAPTQPIDDIVEEVVIKSNNVNNKRLSSKQKSFVEEMPGGKKLKFENNPACSRSSRSSKVRESEEASSSNKREIRSRSRSSRKGNDIIVDSEKEKREKKSKLEKNKSLNNRDNSDDSKSRNKRGGSRESSEENQITNRKSRTDKNSRSTRGQSTSNESLSKTETQNSNNIIDAKNMKASKKAKTRDDSSDGKRKSRATLFISDDNNAEEDTGSSRKNKESQISVAENKKSNNVISTSKKIDNTKSKTTTDIRKGKSRKLNETEPNAEENKRKLRRISTDKDILEPPTRSGRNRVSRLNVTNKIENKSIILEETAAGECKLKSKRDTCLSVEIEQKNNVKEENKSLQRTSISRARKISEKEDVDVQNKMKVVPNYNAANSSVDVKMVESNLQIVDNIETDNRSMNSSDVLMSIVDQSFALLEAKQSKTRKTKKDDIIEDLKISVSRNRRSMTTGNVEEVVANEKERIKKTRGRPKVINNNKAEPSLNAKGDGGDVKKADMQPPSTVSEKRARKPSKKLLESQESSDEIQSYEESVAPSTPVKSNPRSSRVSSVLSTPERAKRKLKPKVVFTMMDSPELESAIRQLGGTVVDTVDACTVLVTISVKRSQKLLTAVGQGKPICSPNWLKESKKNGEFLDPWDFILEDPEAEKKWDFKLKESINRGLNNKLLHNYVVQLIVNSAQDVLKGAIEACGGKCVGRTPAKGSSQNFIIVSTAENKSKYSAVLKKNPNAIVIEPEAIFDGVLRQELRFNKHLLK